MPSARRPTPFSLVSATHRTSALLPFACGREYSTHSRADRGRVDADALERAIDVGLGRAAPVPGDALEPGRDHQFHAEPRHHRQRLRARAGSRPSPSISPLPADRVGDGVRRVHQRQRRLDDDRARSTRPRASTCTSVDLPGRAGLAPHAGCPASGPCAPSADRLPRADVVVGHRPARNRAAARARSAARSCRSSSSGSR